MTMIKALFFDLDGTLLNTEKKISPMTRRALEKCREKGAKLYVATARPPLLDRMLLWDDTTISLFDGGVYHNGGCVVFEGNKIYTSISDRVVKKSIEYACQCDGLNIALQLEGEDHAFRYPIDKGDHQIWGINDDKISILNQGASLNVVKILIFRGNITDANATPIDGELLKRLEDLCRNSAQLYLTDKGKCVQIMASSVSKLSGIEKIMAALGYAKDEIAVFGDDVNDLEMLSAYPNSIAMGNADDFVKARAGNITLGNDRDGVAHAIQEILQII